MDLYDVMRTTGAVRRFTDDPLPDEVVERILDNARFAPSGGNRQGFRVIVVRDRATREAIVGLSVTGEGIETEQQREMLRDLGCERGQGFLFARPCPAADLAPLLHASRAIGTTDVRLRAA